MNLSPYKIIDFLKAQNNRFTHKKKIVKTSVSKAVHTTSLIPTHSLKQLPTSLQIIVQRFNNNRTELWQDITRTVNLCVGHVPERLRHELYSLNARALVERQKSSSLNSEQVQKLIKTKSKSMAEKRIAQIKQSRESLIQSLNGQLFNQNCQINRLNQQLQKYRTTLHTFDQATHPHFNLHSLLLENQALKKEQGLHSELQAENERIRLKLEQMPIQFQRELNQKIGTMRRQHDTLVKTLQSNIQSRNYYIDQMQAELNQIKAQKNALQTQLALRRQDMTELSRTVELKEAKLAFLNEQIEYLKSQIDRLQFQIQSKLDSEQLESAKLISLNGKVKSIQSKILKDHEFAVGELNQFKGNKDQLLDLLKEKLDYFKYLGRKDSSARNEIIAELKAIIYSQQGLIKTLYANLASNDVQISRMQKHKERSEERKQKVKAILQSIRNSLTQVLKRTSISNQTSAILRDILVPVNRVLNYF